MEQSFHPEGGCGLEKLGTYAGGSEPSEIIDPREAPARRLPVLVAHRRGETVFWEVIASHPVVSGVLAWPGPRTTVILKVTCRRGAGGLFEEVAPWERQGLGLDVFDDAGHLLSGTDFAPYKPACDVILVGPDARLRPATGSMRIAGRELHLEPHTLHGPRESVFDGGDPNQAPELWTHAQADFTRFQGARPTHRMPFPTGEIDVDVLVDDARVAGRYAGPFPRATATSPDGGRVFGRCPLALDTIGLSVRAGLLVLTFRGLLDHNVPSGDARLVIDLCDRFGILWRNPQWVTIQPTTPETAQRGRPPGARAGASGLPLEQTAAAPSVEGTVVAPAASTRSPARTMPFAPPATPPAAPQRSGPAMVAFADLRAPVAHVAPAWESDGRTAMVSLPRSAVPKGEPPAAPPRFVLPPTAPEPPPLIRPGAPLAFTPPAPPLAPPSPASTSTASTSTASASPAPPVFAAEPTGGGEGERVAAIQREIWRGDRDLRDILAEHGLSELQWRALRRGARQG